MNEPFFTVIIPTYNRAERIAATIASVLKQHYRDFELIVIDDGSTDNTEEIISMTKDDRLIYRKKENEERAVARNFGVAMAKGIYTTFLDSDDRLYPDHLEVARKNLMTLGQPEVYHQGYEVVDDLERVRMRFALKEPSINELLFTRGNVMSCMGVFLKRETARANPFNENKALTGVEDWELWIRLAAQFVIHSGSTITGAVIQHANRSVSQMSEASLIERMEVLLTCVYENKLLSQKYARLVRWLEANTMTYVSLHLSELPASKTRALRYLIQAISKQPAVLTQRRTFAVLRNVLLR